MSKLLEIFDSIFTPTSMFSSTYTGVQIDATKMVVEYKFSYD